MFLTRGPGWLHRGRPRPWVLALAAATVLLSGVVGTLSWRYGILDAVSLAARRASVQRQPATWRESAPPSSVLLTVDTNRILRPISPLIYGIAAASADELAATGATLNRWGGNPNSRYNWVNGSAWNAARDWQFRNYGLDSSTSLPSAPSNSADRFVSTNQTYGAKTLITIPALGWVARVGARTRRP